MDIGLYIQSEHDTTYVSQMETLNIKFFIS
jgi:hypothetical protein